MADEFTIRTNGRWYHTFGWDELTKKERGDFDYMNTEERQQNGVFVRYRGMVYDLNDSCRIDARIAPHPAAQGLGDVARLSRFKPQRRTGALG